VFDVLLTRAENCFVPPDTTEAVAGETVTTTPPELETVI